MPPSIQARSCPVRSRVESVGEGHPSSYPSIRRGRAVRATVPAGAPLQTLLLSTGIVALAEIGDTTQHLSLVLAARYRHPWPIVAGILTDTSVARLSVVLTNRRRVR